MSQHTHTTCDGCGGEMELYEFGQMSGTIGFYDQDLGTKHFHSPSCLAKFAEKANNGLIGASRIHVTVVEELE